MRVLWISSFSLVLYPSALVMESQQLQPETRVKVNLLQDREILKYYVCSKILQEICSQARI